MKTLFTALTLFALFLEYSESSAMQNDFTLKMDRDTISITAGESATFNLNVAIENGFDASIFLSLTTGSLQIDRGEVSLSTNLLNSPYTGAKLTIKTIAYFTKSGLYEFQITGTNGLLKSTAKCYLRVTPVPRSSWRIMPLTNLMSRPRPEYIIQDEQGNYWHNLQGIHKENSDTPIENWGQTLTDKYSFTWFPPVIDYKHDKMWLFGAATVGPVSFTKIDGTYQTVYPILSNRITAYAVDTKNDVAWVGTTKGLARLAGKDWTVFDLSNSKLDAELITSIILSNSIVWIGTTNGLVRFDGTEWTRFTPQNTSIPARLTRVMAVESDGSVWVGLSKDSTIAIDDWVHYEPKTMIGLAKFDGINWTLYDSKNSPLHEYNYANAVAIDKKGNKWVATASHLYEDPLNGDTIYGGSGLLKFDNTTWTAFTTANSPLPGNKINWVGTDNNDNVWFHQYLLDFPDGFWGVFNENGLPPFLAPPTGVDEQPEATDGITIYPNPASTSFTISGADNILSVKILNSLGMEVVSRTSSVVSGTVDGNVADLASGIYFVQMRTPSGVITKSIVVSR